MTFTLIRFFLLIFPLNLYATPECRDVVDAFLNYDLSKQSRLAQTDDIVKTTRDGSSELRKVKIDGKEYELREIGKGSARIAYKYVFEEGEGVLKFPISNTNIKENFLDSKNELLFEVWLTVNKVRHLGVHTEIVQIQASPYDFLSRKKYVIKQKIISGADVPADHPKMLQLKERIAELEKREFIHPETLVKGRVEIADITPANVKFDSNGEAVIIDGDLIFKPDS